MRCAAVLTIRWRFYSLDGLPLRARRAVSRAGRGQRDGIWVGALPARAYRKRYATGEHDIPVVTIIPDIPAGDGQLSLADFVCWPNSVRRVLSSARAATRSDFPFEGPSEAQTMKAPANWRSGQ